MNYFLDHPSHGSASSTEMIERTGNSSVRLFFSSDSSVVEDSLSACCRRDFSFINSVKIKPRNNAAHITVKMVYNISNSEEAIIINVRSV